MAYCIKCGQQVDDQVKFCPECGAEMPACEAQRSQEAQGMNRQNVPVYQAGQDSQGYQNYQSQGQDQGTYQGYEQQYAGQSRYAEERFDPGEVKANKAMGILAYFGLLVLIPLFGGNKSSEYVKLHTNQGLIIFVVRIISDLIFGGSFFGIYVPIIPNSWFKGLINLVVGLILLVLAIMGIVSAAKGTKKELPIIGGIKFIK